MTPKVSCIVPAYNEASRIADVLTTVVDHPHIHEVIVVDDGSADNTADVVEQIDGVRLVRLPENKGKTWAVTVGIQNAEGSHLLLVDADLFGLEQWHISDLIAPVTSGEADISISLRTNAPRAWHWIGIDYISGERVLPRALLIDRIEELRALPKFGLEVYMNTLLVAEKARIAVVKWPGVKSPFKNAKYGWRQGIIADVKMIRDMFRTVPPWKLAAQIYLMRRRRV